MSFISRLVDPNPPLTAAQVQQAAAAAIVATPPAGTVKAIQRGSVSLNGGEYHKDVSVTLSGATSARLMSRYLGSGVHGTASAAGGCRILESGGSLKVRVGVFRRGEPRIGFYEIYQI